MDAGAEPGAPAGGASGAPNLAMDAGTGFDAGEPVVFSNCGDITCRAAEKCTVDLALGAVCVCDDGYLGEPPLTECVPDPDCIRIRLLESGCRQKLGNEPAIGMFFAVETCAGTAVLPRDLPPLEEAFAITADGQPPDSESSIAIIERDVESYVTVALDFSSSVIEDGEILSPIIDQVREMLAEVEAMPDEAPVSVSLVAFGRVSEVVLPFTRDFEAVDAKLVEMEANPDDVVSDPNGTDLNGAVNLGIEKSISQMDARFLATNGDVLTTSTLLVVTDGDDTSGRALVLSPRVNVITIGISADIDDTALTAIGTQGSFLAPEAADRAVAFGLVAQRVREYPESAYLLGYCSPALVGDHTIDVDIDAETPAAVRASCGFCAARFGEQDQCNFDFFDGYCSTHGTCGSFLACGECSAVALEDEWAYGTPLPLGTMCSDYPLAPPPP